MPKDLMYDCELKKLFIKDGKRAYQWAQVAVSTLESGSANDIRCLHCHGMVRVHKKKVLHGPNDHVEHRARQDSENCKGGAYFKGTHRMSLIPVE